MLAKEGASRLGALGTGNEGDGTIALMQKLLRPQNNLTLKPVREPAGVHDDYMR